MKNKHFFILFLSFLPLILSAQIHFKHRDLAPGNERDAKGLQAVHQLEQIIYAIPGETIRLDPPALGEFCFYRRWFWYEDETNIAKLNDYLTFPKVDYQTFYGNIVLESEYQSTSGKTLHIPSIRIPDNMGIDDEIVIACDQANYKNYTTKNSAGYFVEPTLSQRVLFRIRNAQKVANAIETCYASTPDGRDGNFYETIHITAPAGRTLRIGPSFTFTQHPTEDINYHPNYFALDGENKPISLTDAEIDNTTGIFLHTGNTWSCHWQWTTPTSSTQMDIKRLYSCRFIEIPASATANLAGQERTYYLQTKTKYEKYENSWTPTKTKERTYNICKIIVTYLDPTTCGPTLTPTNTNLLDNAQLLYEQNFDFNKPGTTNPTYYDKPLPWADATYGFYHYTLDLRKQRGISPHTGPAPYWSDYALMNTSDGLKEWFYPGLYNYGPNQGSKEDATNGYFLYVDAARKPSTAISLNLKDPGFCAGTTLWFSAFLAALNNDNDAPNLDFMLYGKRHDGTTDRLATFTTGDLVENAATDPLAGKWQRVLFPFHLESPDLYSDYILILLCKGNSTDGNDLAIDKIQILASLPPVYPIQATAPICLNPEGDDITTYLRIDPGQAIGEGVQGVYYRWTEYNEQTKDYQPIEMDYWRNSGFEQGWQYGYVDRQAFTTAKEYTSIEEFDADITSGQINLPTIAKVVMDIDDRKDVNVLFIATQGHLRPGNLYRGQVSTDPATIEDNKCGSYADLEIVGSMYITLNGQRFIPNQTHFFCGDQWINFGVERRYTRKIGNTEEVYPISCSADWLWGTEDYIAQNPEDPNMYYGCTFEQIHTALLAVRNNQATTEQAELIQKLENDRLLFRNRETYPGYLIADHGDRTLYYTAFPIRSTAKDPAGKPIDIEICTEPIACEVQVQEVISEIIRIGHKTEYDQSSPRLPQVVTSTPRVIRISENDLQANQITIPIFAAGTFSLAGAYLVYTDEPDIPVGENAGMELESVEKQVGTYTSSITLKGIKQLKGGYTYAFRLIAEVGEDECSKKEMDFTIAVVPSQVIWHPTNSLSAWNDDANWHTTDGRPAFVPLADTRVLLEAGKHYVIPYPEASDLQRDTVLLEPNAEQYISYDIGFVPYACQDIYIPAGTTLLNQHLLHLSGKAIVDMAVPTNQWVLCAMPTADGVSGDFWTPAQGENQDNPFLVATINQTTGTYAADRLNHEVWQSLFNKSLSNLGDYEDGSHSRPIVSSEWTEPLNALNTPYPAGMGVALWVENIHNEPADTFRLPKSDTQYHYFNNSNHYWRSDPVVTIDRPASGRLAYQVANEQEGMTITLTNHQEGQQFLFGNPTLAAIDISKLIEGNANILSTEWHILTEGTQVLTANIPSFSADGQDHTLLMPMRGVILSTKQPSYSLTIQLTPAMLQSPDLKKSPVPAFAPQDLSTQDNTLYISATSNGSTSKTALREDCMALNTYQNGEDAQLFLLDQYKTPFAIYTLSEDLQPLALNTTATTEMIPLVLYAQQPIDDPVLTLEGDNYYLNQLEIVDMSLGKSIPLFNGISLPLSMPQDGSIRYFLNRRFSPDTPTDNTNTYAAHIHAYGDKGQLIVQADQPMQQVQIYDVVGHLIYQTDHTTNEVICHLPTGTYIVHAMTQNNVHTLSVIVR